MINRSCCKLTANLLQSVKCDIVINSYKALLIWCQERDSNPRPPAYEDNTKTQSILSIILSGKNYSSIKYLNKGTIQSLSIKLKTNSIGIDAPLHLFLSSLCRNIEYIYCKLTANFFNNILNLSIIKIICIVSLIVLTFVLVSQYILRQIKPYF